MSLSPENEKKLSVKPDSFQTRQRSQEDYNPRTEALLRELHDEVKLLQLESQNRKTMLEFYAKEKVSQDERIQELKQKNEALEVKNHTLEARIRGLEAENAVMKK